MRTRPHHLADGAPPDRRGLPDVSGPRRRGAPSTRAGTRRAPGRPPARRAGAALLVGALLGSACGEGGPAATDGALGLSAGEAALRDEAAREVLPREPENLVFDPLELPEEGFEDAPLEVEPNDTWEEAQRLEGDLRVRGTLEGRDSDQYVVIVEGPPRWWVMEVEGDGIHGVRYRDVAGYVLLDRGPGNDGTVTLSALDPLPGEHGFEVYGGEDGVTSEYTLRLVPLDPDPVLEREPNDGVSRADRLPADGRRVGYLDVSDHDVYRFFLRADARVALRLASPPDRALVLYVEDDAGVRVAAVQGEEPGDTLRWEGHLHPGEYRVRVSPGEGATTRMPYELRLVTSLPSALFGDVEPNDRAFDARPLPPSLHVEGSLDGLLWDEDWYRLPPRDGPAAIRVEGIEAGDRRPDHLVGLLDGGGSRRDDLWEWSPEDGLFRGSLPPGEELFLVVTGPAGGGYRFRVRLDPGPAPAEGDRLDDVVLSLPPDPRIVAAYLPESQETTLELRVEHRGVDPVEVEISGQAGEHRWSVEPERRRLRLEPGGEVRVPLRLRVPPGAAAGAVRVGVVARDPAGREAEASALVGAACGAPPVAPGSPWTVPEAVLGAVNVAWSGLGARVVGGTWEDAALIDGYLPADLRWRRWSNDFPAEVVVELATPEAVEIRGVLLNLQGDGGSRNRAQDVEVELSEDGAAWVRVLAARLPPVTTDQVFVLEEPRRARFARFRVVSSWGGSFAGVGDFKVLAAPGATPAEREGVDIAERAVGGAVVLSRPPDLRAGAALGDDAGGDFVRVVRIDPLVPTEWVVGFHHQRAARIRRLEWVQGDGSSPNLDRIRVSFSVVSPLGPWEPLGEWALHPEAGPRNLRELPEPVWARYVRFQVPAPDEVEWRVLPERIRIFEAPATGGYRSVLGEWGRYSSLGPLEWSGAGAPPPPAAVDGDAPDRPDEAVSLEPGRERREQAWVGRDVDWYRIGVPRDHNHLRVRLRGLPELRVVATLVDGQGSEIPLADRFEGGTRVLETEVEPGATYRLGIEEPPRSIVLAWDNSGSVSAFSDALYGALAHFVERTRPGVEFVNLLPFGNPGRLLLQEWSDDPVALQRAVATYDRSDGSSDAEGNLLTAAEALAERPGTRAVVLMGDHEYTLTHAHAEMWSALERVRPLVFAVELHRGGDDVPVHQDPMQAYAVATGGGYRHFQGGADLDAAMEGISCALRRPARYGVSVETSRVEPPGPGRLAVAQAGLPYAAVELILDASGSMLQRLEGRRRIEIARDVLGELVRETLPEGTPLAFRVFGHRKPDACDTELVVPLGPLDPARVSEIVAGTRAMNLARTPIGASLAAASGDLEDAGGPSLVVLITDGEETCEGDPARAIEGLKAAGLDVRLSIVGFAIEDGALKDRFERWAALGGGRYFDAAGAAELSRALRSALQPKFQVLDGVGEVVAEGTAGEGPVALPPGRYAVRVLTSPVRTHEEVEIRSGETTTVGGEPGS